MPNGYDWLETAQWSRHTYDRWVIQTGCETREGAETDTFREPDAVESRLIDVALSKPMSGGYVLEMPALYYKTMKFTGGVPQDEGTVRWIYDAKQEVSTTTRPGTLSSKPYCRLHLEQWVVASTWFVAGETLEWKDALFVSTGCEGEESLMMVLKSSELADLRSARRTLYNISALMAVRIEESTVWTMPKFRKWDGTIQLAHNEPDDDKLVKEVIQRSLVARHGYRQQVPPEECTQDTEIDVRLLHQEQFLNLMD